MKDALFVNKNLEKKVDSFKSVLDKITINLNEVEEQHKSSVIVAIQKTDKIHNDFNARLLDVAKKQQKFDANYQSLEASNNTLSDAHLTLIKRHQELIGVIEALTQDVRNVQKTKEDKTVFHEQKLEVQSIINRLLDSQDENKNKLMTMEHFIDKYVPIRIQQQLGETLQTILGRTMLQKLETFEMSKYKSLNEDVLDDEKHPELLDRA